MYPLSIKDIDTTMNGEHIPGEEVEVRLREYGGSGGGGGREHQGDVTCNVAARREILVQLGWTGDPLVLAFCGSLWRSLPGTQCLT